MKPSRIIGNNVRRLREAAGYTQEGLGKALPLNDVAQSTISRIERGEAATQNMQVLEEIAVLFGLDVMELFERRVQCPTCGDIFPVEAT